MRKHKCRSLCLVATSLLIASGSAWSASPGETHTVGGTISGLAGKGLILRLNSQSAGIVELSPSPGAVRFVFPAGLAAGSAYAVTVQAQPADPTQKCVVTRGQGGRIGTTDAVDVMVDCNISTDAQRRQSPDPRLPHAWDLYVDNFQVDVDVENISYSDGYCSMSGGTVNAKFRESALTRNKPLTGITWDPDRRSTSISIEFKVDSDATVGPQSGQSSPGAPLKCDAMSHHFDNNTYRLDGQLSALTGSAVFTSPMPQNDDTAGNIGCVPESHTCTVQFWFDNSPGTARTSVDLSTLLATGSVVVPIRGTATNVAAYGEKRSGNFRWSGSMTLRAVKRGP